jgi:flagellar biosynthesis/type III secretory pathway M-ring protein FliF/YscJ
VLVNDFSDKKIVDGKLIGSTYKRSPAQLKQLQDLAAAVIGMDSQRGDAVTVENMTFSDGADLEVPPTFAERAQTMLQENATALRNVSLLGLLVLAWVLFVRPVQTQIVAVVRELGSGTESAVAALEAPQATALPEHDLDHLLEADTSTVGLKRRVTEMVQAEPATMTRTLQAWLQESEG